MPWHVRDSLPPPNLSSLRKGRKKHQHLARRWGEKSEGERGEEGRQRKGGRERKGAFTNTTKLQIWLPRLSPHHCKEMKTHFKLEPFPTPLQPPPHALSPGASAHVYQKLNRTREAQNLLCVCERRERASKRERKGGGRGGGGHSFIKYNPPFLLLNLGGSPSPPPSSLIFPPDGVTGAASSEGYFASFSLTQTRAPAGPRWVHTRTHTLAPTFAHAGAHAQVVIHQGQRRQQQEHARMALQAPNLAIHLQSDPQTHTSRASPPKKKKCLPATHRHTHTHTK